MHTTPPRACITFEDLKLGLAYKTGESFFTSGASFLVEPFEWGTGTPTSSGHTNVDSDEHAGGTGNEMALNNVNLDLTFDQHPTALSLLFGEHGGSVNININGEFFNIDRLLNADGLVIGGVKVSIVQGYWSNTGHIYLTGPVKRFILGGQELWIDTVCF